MGDIVKFTEATVGELDSKLKDVRIPRANLGPCPVCGRDIVENRKGYSCWSREDPGCGFVIWKAKAGKQLPVTVARELIKTGRTEQPVTGFKGRSGKSFRARLALQQTEEGKWRVEFDEPWAREGAKPPEAEEAADGSRAEAPAESGAPPERRRQRRPRRSGEPPPSGAIASRRARATIGAMPLTLVLGPANSAKAGEVLGAYAAAAPPRGGAGRADRARRPPLRARAGRRGVVLGSVLTFGGLARRDRAPGRLRRPAAVRSPARAGAGAGPGAAPASSAAGLGRGARVPRRRRRS